MLKVIIITVIAAQLHLWSTDMVAAEAEPSCEPCAEGEHCEHFLKNNDCKKAPCEFTPKCVKTTGITCANVRCARARCYMSKKCGKDSENCKPGPRCVPVN